MNVIRTGDAAASRASSAAGIALCAMPTAGDAKRLLKGHCPDENDDDQDGGTDAQS